MFPPALVSRNRSIDANPWCGATQSTALEFENPPQFKKCYIEPAPVAAAMRRGCQQKAIREYRKPQGLDPC
jgi:hypothetical protein